MKTTSFLILSWLVCSLSLAAVEPPKVVNLWPNGAPEAKGNRPEDTPRLEVYCPTGDPCGAAIVVFPGGGYGSLAADHEGRQVAQLYNSLGVTAFVLHYRLGTNGYHHPVELNDAKRAIRWVRDHAEEYRLDRARIGITGFSAGGHLASTAATLFDGGDPNAPDPVDRVTSRPDFLVLGYPVITMGKDFGHMGSRNNLLGPAKDDEKLATALSSQLNVTDKTPPTFIFQTDEDTSVPAENAVSFYLALRKHKVPAEMHIYQRGPHGVGLMHGDPVLSTWGRHLTDWLRNNGWLSTVKKAPLEGTVFINGVPVSWGAVTFYPEDKQTPVVSLRVMKGKFADTKSGVPIGRHRVKITYSSADVPALTEKEAPAGVMETSKITSKDNDDIFFEVKEGPGSNKLDLLIAYP